MYGNLSQLKIMGKMDYIKPNLNIKNINIKHLRKTRSNRPHTENPSTRKPREKTPHSTPAYIVNPKQVI